MKITDGAFCIFPITWVGSTLNINSAIKDHKWKPLGLPKFFLKVQGVSKKMKKRRVSN